MKGMIDANGFLRIERVGRYKLMTCPFNSTTDLEVPCGESCPLFGEPQRARSAIGDRVGYGPGSVTLQICHRELRFDEFIDGRSLPEPPESEGKK